MEEKNYLLVPMDVKAMAVNDKTRIGQNFQRWKMIYQSLDSYNSPRPDAFSGNTAINWRDDPSANGIYLHWTLPEALRNGVQNSATGITDFPLVPNRWVIVRYSGPLNNRIAVAWVVESDYLDPKDGTSAYIDPFSKTLQATNIGRKIDLSGWKETGGSKDLFLKAVGPGDVTFAAYQPYIENVFSIHDPLAGVADQDTLSYLVAGWYSDPTKDILAGWSDSTKFIDFITSLKWQVNEPGKTAHSSVYHGMVYGIRWDKNGDIPVSDKPSDPSKVMLSVGNTSIDALTALIGQQASAQGKTEILKNIQLLEAFQYNLLPTLDQPNGKELLYQAIHKAWFGALSGGVEWIIMKKPPESDSLAASPFPAQSSDTDDKNLHPEWLPKLNQAQKDFDTAARDLASAQWRLYGFWISAGKFSNLSSREQKTLKSYDKNFIADNFSGQLNPANSGTLAFDVAARIRNVNRLAENIPHGDTDKAMQKSIDDYAAAHGLPPDYVLKRINREFFFEANDPVVLVSGAKVSDILTSDKSLSCRFIDRTVKGFTFDATVIDSVSMKGGIPTVPLDAVPAPVASLLTEFFFLDPFDAALVSANALGKSDPETIQRLNRAMADRAAFTGALPDFDATAWTQPWAPLFLLWQIQYYPIAHDTNGIDNWTFDGKDYTWTGNGAIIDPLSLSGIVFLTPQCSFNFKSRLEEYRQKHPFIDPDTLPLLEDFIDKTDDWDFLSQSLEGFNRQLAMRSVESNVVPSDPLLPGLIGKRNSIIPMPGNTPEPFKGWTKSDFQQIRSGQFAFQRLMIVDRFGQSLEILTSDTSLQYRPVISDDLKPSKTVLAQEPYRFIEVGPRILQSARLDFEYVSAEDDNKIINYENDIDPICAWILPNHIDRSLNCYDPMGAILGELAVVTDSTGQKIVSWEGFPGSSYPTPLNVKKDFPHLGELLIGLIGRGVSSFTDFYKVIDETLWLIDPLGARDDQYLSVLIGRPLALVRTRLQFQLNGNPVSDPTWRYVFNPTLPDFIDYDFPVRLGELVLRNDGLIGYFSGNDYDHFNSVNPPPQSTGSNPYIRQVAAGNYINLKFKDDSIAYVTMFIDPRASVHATTGILPTTILDLPARFVNPALANMEITFHAGPLLGAMDIPKDSDGKKPGDTKTILMPVPAEKNGKWAWLSHEKETWVSYPIKQVDQSADLSNINPILRSGFLQLSHGETDGNK